MAIITDPGMKKNKQIEQIFKEITKEKVSLFSLLKEIASIPSPTGSEKKKMLFLKEKLKEIDMEALIDNIGNCIVKLSANASNSKKKTILVVAHADTACDPGKDHKITEDARYIYGHGICDDSTGITGLLTTISLIKKHKITFSNDLIFAFTVGEEGLGGKRGMKQIIKDYGKQIDAVINVESHHIGRVTNQVIGQYRSELLIDTKVGGHSFRDFGRPNANVILAQIISDFSHFKLPQIKGKTTFNFGQIKGDGNINAIPKNASCLFEIRSENNESLQKAKQTFKLILEKYREQYPDIAITENVSAEVPAVIFPADHRIYKITMDIQKQLEIDSKLNAGNTDGDVSLAKGIPTVTIGTSEGWNTHSLNEYMEKKSFQLGIKQVFGVIHTIASSY